MDIGAIGLIIAAVIILIIIFKVFRFFLAIFIIALILAALFFSRSYWGPKAAEKVPFLAGWLDSSENR